MPTRKGGRPKKPKAEVLSVQIAFRVTEQVAKEADKVAEKRGIGGGRNELARVLLERAVKRRKE